MEVGAVAPVTDPDGDPVDVIVQAITQDEPVVRLEDTTAPDGLINMGDALVRSERQRRGNGRVYRVQFSATDDKGASCTSNFSVSVSVGSNPAVDDGQNFDSTTLK
jgi:hypothetical protein